MLAGSNVGFHSALVDLCTGSSVFKLGWLGLSWHVSVAIEHNLSPLTWDAPASNISTKKDNDSGATKGVIGDIHVSSHMILQCFADCLKTLL